MIPPSSLRNFCQSGAVNNAALASAVAHDGAVVLVKGDDPILRDATVRQLVSLALGADDPSLAVAEFGDDAEAAAIIDAASTPPFLSARRVVVAREVGRFGAEAADILKGYLAAPSPTSVVILVSGGGTISRGLSDAIKRQGTVVDTALPTGKGRQQWLQDRIAAAPVRLDGRAARRLADHLGEDLARVDGILAVLAAVHGEGARLGVSDIEPFLGAGGASAPWDLTDAIDRGDVSGALDQLQRAMGAGDRHPLQLLGSLGSHFSRMLRLDGAGCRDESEAAAVLGMTGSTFPAKKALSQSKRLGSANIARAIDLLHQADLDVRGARELPDSAMMEILVARLSKLAPTGGR
jgi:DNA polymerase III subunit delta